MDSTQAVLDFINHGHEHYLPHLSIDCVIFSYHEQQLRILLIRYYNQSKWSLPGGFIAKDETLTQAANRILAEKTQINNLFLRQFQVFGDSPARLNELGARAVHNATYAKVNMALDENSWLAKRTLSIGYYALVGYLDVVVTPEYLVDEYCWREVTDIPPLLFDHQEIIESALLTLRSQIYQQPIGYNLLPEKFTLPEIHALYETILGKQFDRRNFRKKLLALGLVRQLDERRNIGPHRSPFLYEFDTENYRRALEEGAVLGF
jgi:8-oxo-dGTP diphosphatase